MEASVNEHGVTVNTLVLVVDGLTLNTDTFKDFAQVTTLYYDADGKNITENTDSAAVIVKREDTTDSYTVTVKSKLSSSLTIDGVTAAVTDSNTGTEYQVKNGPTFTATDNFTVDANGVFTETGSGLTVTKGSVSTSDVDAKIDISAAGNEATVTFATGTAANGAVIKTAGGSITLSETGTTTATVVKQDGSLSGLDGSVTVTGVPEGKSVTTSGAGTVSVNGIEFTSTDPDGVTVTPDGVTATTLTIGDLATGHTVTVGTAGKNYNVSGTLYKSVSQGVTLTGTAAALGKDKSVTVDGHDALTNNGETAVTIGYDGAIKLAAGQQFTLGTTTYQVSTSTMTGSVGGTSKTGYLVTVASGDTKKYYLLSDKQLNSDDGVTITDIYKKELDQLWADSSADLVDDTPIVTSGYKETTYFLANGLPLTEKNDDVAATLTVDAEAGKMLEVTSKITAGVDAVEETIKIYDQGGTGTKYTLDNGYSGYVVTAEGEFAVYSGVVTYVAGEMTAIKGTLRTIYGSGTYNVAHDASVGFFYEENTTVNATVIALTEEGKEGDVVTVNGLVDAVSNNGNAGITRLDEVGEKVVITDKTSNPSLGNVTYEVVAVKEGSSEEYPVIIKKTDNVGTVSYWEGTGNNVTDDYCGNELQGAAIVTLDYGKTTYFLANGLPYAKNASEAAAILTVDENNVKTLQVKSAITKGVVAENDTVKIEDKGTTTAYTLTENSHVTAKGATFTTNGGVVSDATGKLTLQGKNDSLKAKGTVNVDASVLVAQERNNVSTLQSVNTLTLNSTPNLGYVSQPNELSIGTLTLQGGAVVTWLAGTAVNGAVLTLGSGSLTITEANNTTDTVFGSNMTLTGLDSGAVITTSGLTDSELASVSTATGGTFTVNGITFSAMRALNVTSVAEAASGTLTVDQTITTGAADKNYNYKVAGTLYKSVSSNVKLTSTTATLASDSIGQTVTVDGHDKVTNNGTVGFDVSSLGEIRLAAGMQFTMGDTVYDVGSVETHGYVGTEENSSPKDGYVVTVTVGDTTKNYLLSAEELSAGVYITDDAHNKGEQGEVWEGAEEDLMTAGMPIIVNSESVTETYSKLGFPTTTQEDIAATVTRNSDGTYTVEITDEILLGVQIDGVTVSLSDKSTGTSYTSATGSFQLQGSGVMDSNGTFTKVEGTLTAATGTFTTADGGSAAKYSLGDGTAVTFQNGNSVGTTVATGDNTLTIEENSNPNDTTVKYDTTAEPNVSITGLDDGAVIKGALDGTTLATTGSGTLTINGTSWTVENDTDGVTFTVDNSSNGKLNKVDGLDNDATLSTRDNASGMSFAGCKLISAQEGFTYTAGSPGTFTFAYAGAEIVANGYTYTINNLADKVSLDTTGKLTSLTEGEKVTVTKDGVTFTYEVGGGTMLVTRNDGSEITTVTNLLAEGETDGYTILAGSMEAVNKSTDSSKTQTNVGLEVNNNGISTVTNGMLLDKNGQATLSEEKAVATVTIQGEDTLQYQAKEVDGQEVKVTNKSAKTWTINLSGKNDNFVYDGTGAATISAGAGNDSLSLTGTGEVQVNGVSGNNRITHTGTGAGTLIGGSGNDTLTSYNASDVLTGGAGDDIFILTNVESNVTDFTYYSDKAIVTSTTGALDYSQIKVTSEGVISYGGTGSTGGSMKVSGQGFDDFYAANLTDASGKNQVNVGWSGAQGAMIDGRDRTERILLIGNDNASDDSLIGGKNRDTIVAGNGNTSIWSGAGNDLMVCSDTSNEAIFFLEGDGNDTVTGFTAYTGSSSDNPDTLNLAGQGVTDVQNTSQGVQVYHGKDKLTLSGNYTANSMIQWESGDAKGLAKIGKKGAKNDFSYHEEVTNYLGSTGTDTLTLGTDVDDANIWLDGSQGTTYDSIEVIDASKVTGNATLAGGQGANTITGGKGSSSLWGGSDKSKDVLNAGSGDNVFYYGLNEGNDVINNSKSDDKVMLYNIALSDLKGATISNSQIIVTQNNGQKLTVNGKASEFTLSDGSTWSADRTTKTWTQIN